MEKPLMTYDRDCAYCKFWVERWKKTTGDRVDYRPSDGPIAAVRFELPDGRKFEAAEAVFEARAFAPGKGWLIKAYRKVPGFAAVSEWGYRFTAKHRPLMFRLTKLVYGVKGPEVCSPDDGVCRTRH